MPCTSFNVNGKLTWAELNLLIELIEDCQYGRVIRAYYVVVIRADNLPKLGLTRCTTQVVDSDLPPRPLPKNRRRVVSRYDFWLVVQRHFEIALHHAAAPGCNPPLACQCPQRHVAESNDDIGLAHLDFTLEEFEAVTDGGENELVPQHDMLRRNVGFLLRDESVDVIARWADANDVRDKALGAHDARFLKHLGHFLSGEADEGLTLGDLPFPRSFPHDHDLGWARPGWVNLHGHFPPQRLLADLLAARARASSRATSALA